MMDHFASAFQLKCISQIAVVKIYALPGQHRNGLIIHVSLMHLHLQRYKVERQRIDHVARNMYLSAMLLALCVFCILILAPMA